MDERCRVCGEVKPLDELYRAAGTRDGRRGECKACNLARKASWYRADRERREDRHGLEVAEFVGGEVYELERQVRARALGLRAA